MSRFPSFAICLEDLDASSVGDRYLQCVALPGRQPGLRVDGEGAVKWKQEVADAVELWVSSDERLMLYRPLGGASAVVRRGGRSLEAPFEKPVILLDQDQIDVGGRRLRVHIHGTTTSAAPPMPFRPKERTTGGLTRFAAAIAVGAVVGAAGCDCGQQQQDPVEVREIPPAPPLEQEHPPFDSGIDGGAAGSDGAPGTATGDSGAATEAGPAQAPDGSAGAPRATDAAPAQTKAVKAPPPIKIRHNPPGPTAHRDDDE